MSFFQTVKTKGVGKDTVMKKREICYKLAQTIQYWGAAGLAITIAVFHFIAVDYIKIVLLSIF